MSEKAHTHAAETDDLAMIREAHAAQPYEFKTDLTYCPSSDVPTDQCHTCIVLAQLDDLRARAAALANRWDRENRRPSGPGDQVTAGVWAATKADAAELRAVLRFPPAGGDDRG